MLARYMQIRNVFRPRSGSTLAPAGLLFPATATMQRTDKTPDSLPLGGGGGPAAGRRERPNMGSGAAANTERGAGQGGPRHQKQPNSHAWKLTAWPAPGRKRAREAADRGGKIYAETKRASQIEEDRGA